MIRLKDFTTLLYNMPRDEINVIVYDIDGNEIEYDSIDKYINRIIDKIDIKSDTYYEITLSKDSGDSTLLRNFIKYHDLVKCIINTDQRIIKPITMDFTSSFISTEYLNKASVIDIYFTKYSINILLSNHVAISYTPIDK